MAERKRRIGYLGRLDEEKGVDVLVEVVKELPEEVTFVFIGDGALRPRIERELADRIEAGSVELTGWVDHEDVSALLGELRLPVMTSRTEGVSTTALEAMACGTPVCATPVGGIPDVVEDWETGLLLDTESAKRAPCPCDTDHRHFQTEMVELMRIRTSVFVFVLT